MTDLAARHDAYAADYDAQVAEYDCTIAQALFGLTYDFIRPGERLLDLGIGTGLSAAPFARAGLCVSGMDFAPAMLDLCRAKGIADDLRQHDLQQIPWPYPDAAFAHVISCGVFHFISGLDAIFQESARVLLPGGTFAFTTRLPAGPLAPGLTAGHYAADGMDVFSHAPEYVARLVEKIGFARVRFLRCFVGQDIHGVWVTRRQLAAGDDER